MTPYKYFHLLFFLFLPVLSYSQTVPEKENALKNIPDIKLENVHGEQIRLSEVPQRAIVLFLLPKPESMSEGKERMSDIRTWMVRLQERFNEKVYTLLIVEPLKTSFPFYNIQKGKLKNETFPIVVDKHGDILQEFDLPESTLHMLIIDKGLKIRDSKLGSYDDGREQETFNQLQHLISQNSADNR